MNPEWYSFQSGDSLVFVTWSTAAEHLGMMIPAADAAMARLQWAAPKEPSSMVEAGEIVRQLAALLGVSFLAATFLRRRKPQEQQQVPPPAP